MKTICTPTPVSGIKLLSHVWLIACLLVINQQATAAIRYVKAGASGSGAAWSNASGDLQAMIDASSSGDQVWVAGGTYQPASGQPFRMKDAVKIYGGFVGAETSPNQRNLSVTTNTSTLQGNGSSVIVSYMLSAAALLDGFTITGGVGSGVYNYTTSSSYANCIISGNTAFTSVNNGGGMYNYQSSSALTNCSFTNNSAYNGGGGMYSKSSSPTLTNCSFTNNSATHWSGGGMSNEDSSPTLTNCSFTNDSAAYFGGGMYNNNSSATLINCTFNNNTAVIRGGGMLNSGTFAALTLTGCSFTNNTTSGNNADGGGVFNWSCAPTFTNCSFTGNTAIRGGGAMYNLTSASPMLTNCTFTNNKASNGGGMCNYDNSAPGLFFCVFTGNESSGGGALYNDGSSPTLSYCTFGNNFSNFKGGGIYTAYSFPTFTSCVFMGNVSNDVGGGMYINHSDPTFTNCVFTNNSSVNNDGGGIYMLQAKSTFTNCNFSGNSTINNGGGMYAYQSDPQLTNCLFSGNSANGGGGVFNISGTVVLTNCRLSGNSANNGGGVFNTDGTVVLTNCTLSGNSANGAGGMYSNGTTTIRNTIVYNNSSGVVDPRGQMTTSYSLIQGINNNTNGNIAGTTDPLFVNALPPGLSTGGDYRLQFCSPVKDNASNGYYAGGQSPDLSTITTDLAANNRFYGTADMGAYELQGMTMSASVAGIVYVKSGASGSGTSWNCPTSDLQAAINLAASGNEVWVAGGTYIPNRRADATGTITTGDRNNAFVMKSGVKIYGGFAGTETALSQRNLSLTANTSTLSADLNANDNGFSNNSENAYHVMISAGNVSTALLDGFTILGGNCDGNSGVTVNGEGVGTNGGGGIFCTNSSPILSNLIIKGNAGRYGAGLCLSASSPVVTNCTITGNAGFYGGGVIGSNSGAIFTNVLISGNTAVEQGGGMYNEWAVAPTLTNVTIAGNTAINGDGGAMYNNLGASLQLRNCIVYNNNKGIYNNNGAPTVQYSLVQGQTSTANGNVSGAIDPLFANPVTPGLNTSGDYHLQTCSPGINAGNGTVYNNGQSPNLAAINTDLNTATRTQGTTVDMGAYEFTGNPATNLLAINSDVSVGTISGSTALTATNSTCRLVATLLPTGAGTALNGNVNARVWIESVQPSSYVKRHYQITPATNATTATGRVTLYFAQQEFNNFNALNAMKLPTSAGDITGIANLLVEKRPGVSSNDTGLPNSYTGTPTTINPADNDIVWNSTLSRWEITFNVTGFSGFFIKTQSSALPLTLLSFTGNRYNGYNTLKWVTADEVNTKHFILERSTDGGSFVQVATIKAAGVGNNTYQYKDEIAFSGKMYYRLKMVDVDEKYTYSSIVTLTNDGNNAVSIYPNPASDVMNINAGNDLLNTKAGIYDVNGRLLQTIVITAIPQTINIQQLANGLYIIKFINGTSIKLVKQH